MTKARQPEKHLIIIWEHARHIESEALQLVKQKFTLIAEYDVTWSKKLFAQNQSRFYGLKLLQDPGKAVHCGDGTFLCLIVVDENPEYGMVETSRGSEAANINLFDMKMRLREMSGGGHRVHTTNTPAEYDHDSTLIFGLDYEHVATKKRKPFKQDIIGTNGWDNLNQIMAVLNHTVNYLVLRNFDDIKNQSFDEHGDVDLLVENPVETAQILNAEKVFQEDYRVHYTAKTTDGKKVYFDFRYVGDGYYDASWQKDMLASRQFSSDYNAFLIDQKNHVPSLIYHAVLHKNSVSEDYLKTFKAMLQAKPDMTLLMQAMAVYMAEHGYKVTQPDDRSVLYQPDQAKKLRRGIVKHRIRKLVSFTTKTR